MRRSSFLLLAAVMALSLTACGGGENPTTVAPISPEPIQSIPGDSTKEDAPGASQPTPSPEIPKQEEETMNPSKKSASWQTEMRSSLNWSKIPPPMRSANCCPWS